MAPRLELQSTLEGLTEHVYFQPPENIKMLFPCITYHLNGDRSLQADNKLYRNVKRYQVTVVDRNPDSALPDLVAELPMCGFESFFTSDGLNHWVYNLFF